MNDELRTNPGPHGPIHHSYLLAYLPKLRLRPERDFFVAENNRLSVSLM